MSKITKHAISAKTHINKYATAKGKTFLAQAAIDVLFNKYHKLSEALDSLMDASWQGLPVKGKAVCSAEDQFNKNIGMSIATSRAKRTGTDRLIRRTKATLKATNELIAELQDLQINLVEEAYNLDTQLINIAQ